MYDTLEYLNAVEIGLGYGFTRPSHPGLILVVEDGDIMDLEDLLEEAPDSSEITDEAFTKWLDNTNLERVPLKGEVGADETEYQAEYHPQCRAEWVAHGRSLV